MRLIKFLLLLLLLLAGFVYINELYINELWNFNGAYFRTSEYHYFENDKERKAFIDTIKDCCSECGVCVFACSSLKRIDTLDYRLTIFADKNDLSLISREFEIEPGNYYSVFSGSIDVVLLPFEKLKDNDWRYISSLSFCGENDDINRAYNKIKESYSITYPKRINGSDRDMAFIVWGSI